MSNSVAQQLEKQSRFLTSNLIVPLTTGTFVGVNDLVKGHTRQRAIRDFLAMTGIAIVNEYLFDYFLPRYTADQPLVTSMHMFMEPVVNGLAYMAYDVSMNRQDSMVQYIMGDVARNGLVAAGGTVTGNYLKSFTDPLLVQ